MPNSLQPHESQHARPPCPSQGVHSNSRPSSWWCHSAISSSVVPFSSCPQSLPASESFAMSWLHMRWPKAGTIPLERWENSLGKVYWCTLGLYMRVKTRYQKRRIRNLYGNIVLISRVYSYLSSIRIITHASYLYLWSRNCRRWVRCSFHYTFNVIKPLQIPGLENSTRV